MSEETLIIPRPTTLSERFGLWRRLAVLLLVALLFLAGWQWFEVRARLAGSEAEMARRFGEGVASQQESRLLLRRAEEQLAAQQAKIAALEARLGEFQAQAKGLENLAADLSKNRDETALVEVEQAIGLAAQQLQLTGNVRAALLALQAAETRLARLERPQFILLRKALARDLERLRAMPAVDVAGIGLRLENIIAGVDGMGLAVDERPKGVEKLKPGPGPGPQRPWWERFGAEAWQEIRGLVRIQRFDRSEPVLLAPGQGFFLREHVKLRLLDARVALLARDMPTYRNDLRVARDWLEKHFDAGDKGAQAAIATLRQLQATDTGAELPTLAESQAALNALRGSKEKK